MYERTQVGGPSAMSAVGGGRGLGVLVALSLACVLAVGHGGCPSTEAGGHGGGLGRSHGLGVAASSFVSCWAF
jgi:hypothetical protein